MFKSDPEFQTLAIQLSKEEKDRVLYSAEHGTIEKIVVWNNTIILGYEYLDIYRDNGIKLRYSHPEIKDRAYALLYATNAQIQRKGLTQEQREYLIGRRFRAEKIAKRWEGLEIPDGRNISPSAILVAKELGNIKPSAVREYARFSAHVDILASNLGDSVRDQILSGKSGFSKAKIERMATTSAEEQRRAWAIGGGKTEEMLITCSDAIAFAITAISHLERIRPDDPHRKEAFAKVTNWIKSQGVIHEGND